MQTNKPTSEITISDLEKMYMECDEADKELFAEMRSNLLLISGEHYAKGKSKFMERLRDTRSIAKEQKIRLTQNHVGKISDSYVNHIVSTAPGVGFEPAQQSELQDQKAAELNHSVWDYGKEKNALDEVVQEWAEDFVGIGEVATKLFFDPTENEIVFEELYGFNLLLPPQAPSFRKSPYAIVRKMVDVKKLKAMFPGEEHERFIQESSDQTYTIFDRGRGGYQKSKHQCLVREFYFRPTPEMPQGYYYYTVKDHILTQDELPAGEFPIRMKPFKRLQTRSRGQSIVKTLRPYQAEINRASSKMAEHQITLGDDKLLIQNGTKVTAGASLPGVRTANYTGAEPKILPGRDGSQYLAYMQAKISEMYAAANVDETPAELNGQLDAYTLLFRSASQKKQFQIHIKRFEAFLKEVCELYLLLARYHFPDDKVIQMIGRKEQVNMAEFRETSPLCYKVKISAQSEDIETKMGKQLVLNHVLQYVGPQLGKEDIGKLIKAMPYSNIDESFNDLTLDYEAATNDILALDRGELPPINEYDDHIYMIKRLTARMRQADFAFLPPPVQQAYAARLAAHETVQAQQAAALQASQAGFIPTTGYLVSCDFYVSLDPKDPSKVKRVRIPSGALQWLIEKLQAQGASLDQLENVNERNLVEIAQRMGDQGAPQGPQSQIMGSAMPGGESNVRAEPGPRNQQPAFAGSNSGPGIGGHGFA